MGIHWVMCTGAPWHNLPPLYQTCHRCFQLWARNETLARVLHQLARDLAAAGGYDFTETSLGAIFAGAKKGGLAVVSFEKEKHQNQGTRRRRLSSSRRYCRKCEFR